MKQSLKRLARGVGRFTGTVISRPWALGTALEVEQLYKIFKRFDVDCVFDVGANEGQYVLMLRDEVGFRGPIVSFEPIPELVEKLRNKCLSDTNWHVRELALDKEAGPAEFNVSSSSTFSSLLEPDFEKIKNLGWNNQVNRKILVRKERLDSIFSELESSIGFRRPFLKLDTQGNDLSVAMGAVECLGRFVGVQSELAITRTYQEASGYCETISFFKSKGFELSSIIHNHPWQFPALIEVDAIFYRVESG
jgi:FkbM family methyltransferase